MPYIRWNDFCHMPVMIPTNIICTNFNNLVKPIAEKIKMISNQNIKLVEARDLILPKLMSGEIEV